MSATIFAAGTVCWRETSRGKIKVLLIRRVKHRDWSFPKGKVDPGETLPVTAVRETYEETGLRVSLGVNLGTINYKVGKKSGPKKNKTVQYWAAKVSRKTAKTYVFEPNSEVYKVKWVKLAKVATKLTYPADRELFSVFEKLQKQNLHDTFPIILLRHAKALSRAESKTSDSARPLTDFGVKQSLVITAPLTSFGVKTIVSSSALRCLDTVAPLAEHTAKQVEIAETISQDHWESGDLTGLRDLVKKLVAAKKATLICSHAPVLPDLAREIAHETNSRPGRYLRKSAELPTAAFSVFHINKRIAQQHGGEILRGDENLPGEIVSVETYPIKI